MSQQINLFNPIFKQQKKYLSAVTMAQALGLILAGSLALTAYAAYRTNRIEAEAARIKAQLAEVQNLQRKVAADFPARVRSQALEAEIQKTEVELQSLGKVASVLHQGKLGNTKGYASYFRAFARQIIDGVWLTGLSIQEAGAEIEIRGRALSPELVPAYIGRLKSEPVMKGKSFSSLDMQVPQAANSSTRDGSSRPAAANYIEFSLQSKGASGQAEGAGAGSR